LETIIRPPKTPEEFRYIEKIQRDAWGASDIDITPTHVCVAVGLANGCVYLAFDGEKPIGFVWGFFGLENNGLYLHSHQLGVLREYQNRNVGYMLKLRQRDFALSHGIDLIKWTFDPLQSKNAYFNFNKLGVVCRRYIIDLYGEIRDNLNRGLPSDRMLVEWHINSPRVIKRIGGEKPPKYEFLPINIPRINEVRYIGGVPHVISVDLDLNDRFLLVEIPSNYTELRARNFKLVLDWRITLRRIFTAYMNRGYIVVDLVHDQAKRRLFYVLTSLELDSVLNQDWWVVG